MPKSSSRTTRTKSRRGFYYRDKDGGKLRYVAEHETPRFLSNGVWLVTDTPHCHSNQLIFKLGEVPTLYPYAQMALDGDDLAAFLAQWRDAKVSETIVRGADGSVTYTLGSCSEQAQAILRYLAMSPDERKAEVERLVKAALYIDRDSDVRDGRGEYIRRATSKDIATLPRR